MGTPPSFRSGSRMSSARHNYNRSNRGNSYSNFSPSLSSGGRGMSDKKMKKKT